MTPSFENTSKDAVDFLEYAAMSHNVLGVSKGDVEGEWIINVKWHHKSGERRVAVYLPPHPIAIVSMGGDFEELDK